MECTFGIYGLGAMGSNLALNLASKKAALSPSDRKKASSSYVYAANWEGDPALVDRFGDRAKDESLDRHIKAFKDLKSFFEAMDTDGNRRIIMIMVTAGAAVDSSISSFKPFLRAGDIIIDGGNEHYKESIRRYNDLASIGVSFVDLGVSGGMEGARNGACFMAGCDRVIFDAISPTLSLISATIQDEPCLIHCGNVGAGNYVKMVHNGIEYALMQVVAEVFSCMRDGCKASYEDISAVLSDWSKDESLKINSFLLDITCKILLTKDSSNNSSNSSSSGGGSSARSVESIQGSEYLLDKISDKCGSKGTGKWTVQEAADRGVSCPTIAASLNSRYISALSEDRKFGSTIMLGPRDVPMVLRSQIVNDLKLALYIFTMISFAQGFAIIRKGFEDLNLNSSPTPTSSSSSPSSSSSSSSSPSKNINGLCCKAWRGGCIIRNGLLPEMGDAYERDPTLSNLLLDNIIAHKSNQFINSGRRVATYMIATGLPCPAILSCISYYDCLRTAKLSTNIIQAQRDYFGGHGFSRVDQTGSDYHGGWK